MEENSGYPKIKVGDIIVVICLFLGLLFTAKGCYNTYGKSTTYKYEVRVSYQYENSNDIRTITYNDCWSFNNSVKSINPVYTVSPGYNNNIIIVSYAEIDGNKNNRSSTKEKVLIFSPDFKVQVTDLKYRKLYE